MPRLVFSIARGVRETVEVSREAIDEAKRGEEPIVANGDNIIQLVYDDGVLLVCKSNDDYGLVGCWEVEEVRG